jgi:hypothetical protein
MCIEGDGVEWMYVLSRSMRAAEGRKCGVFQRKSWIKWFNPKPKMPFKISMFGRPLIRSDKMTVQGFSSSLVQELRTFLGEEGLSFFRELKEEHDTVSPILTIELGGGGGGEVENGAKKRKIPYPVHFHEGRQIRNWMRRQKETANKGDPYYDDDWMSLIEMALGE